MNQTKFIKNLFNTLTTFLTIVFIEVFLVIGYVELVKTQYEYSYIILLFAIGIILSFFILGFYWIFQFVEFTSEGIKVYFLTWACYQHRETKRKTMFGELQQIQILFVKNPQKTKKTSPKKQRRMKDEKSIIFDFDGSLCLCIQSKAYNNKRT